MEENQLEQVSEETMRFMRGKYLLDEVSDGKEELKFRRSGKTILTIYIRKDTFDFLVIFGKAERGKFEEQRETFSPEISEIYDNAKTFHDGKWVTFPVDNLQMLEEVKRLILIKKKPNRKPFSKENAVHGKCGHRCDLCIHYTGGTISGEFRKELEERLTRVWNLDDWSMNCVGCHSLTDPCDQIKCANEKGFELCTACDKYPCANATVASSKIEAKNTLADDITWGILPYVPYQYGN